MEATTSAAKIAEAAKAGEKVEITGSEKFEGAYICIADFRLPLNRQMLIFYRGQTIDDPYLIRHIKTAYTDRPAPIRSLTMRDVQDGATLL